MAPGTDFEALPFFRIDRVEQPVTSVDVPLLLLGWDAAELPARSPEEPDGTELVLEPNDNPAAKTYQQALFEQNIPAAMFFTDDVQADYERIKARGGEFTMPPTQVTGSTIAQVNDTCGNLIQLTQLTWQG